METSTLCSTDGHIRVDKETNTVLITDFTLNDPLVVEYFISQSTEQWQEKFKMIIQAGMLALKSADVGERVDYVKKEFDQLKQDMNTTIDGAVCSMNDYFNPQGKIPTMMEQYVGEKGDMRQVISNMVTEWTNELHKSLDPKNDEGLLFELKRDLIERLEEIKSGVTRKDVEESMEAKTPAKGKKFEEYCYDMISDMAHTMNDIVSDVSKTIGDLARAKTGDIVIDIAQSKARISIEVKDTRDISSNSVEDLLNKAIENRNANFGLFIVRDVESFKKSMGWFHEFNSGNKLAIALGSKADDRNDTLHKEILLIAYKWARARALENIQSRGTIDTITLEAEMKNVRDHIKNLSKIRTDVKTINATTDNIEKVIKDVLTSTNTTLDKINRSLQEHGNTLSAK